MVSELHWNQGVKCHSLVASLHSLEGQRQKKVSLLRQSHPEPAACPWPGSQVVRNALAGHWW